MDDDAEYRAALPTIRRLEAELFASLSSKGEYRLLQALKRGHIPSAGLFAKPLRPSHKPAKQTS